jgi:hypothetical protein
LGFEKGGWHTRLPAGVYFDIWFLGASPLSGVGLSAPIYFAALRKFRFNPLRLARQRVFHTFGLLFAANACLVCAVGGGDAFISIAAGY